MKIEESNILGITSGCDSGVALFRGGKLVLAVNEERLSRNKFDEAYPRRALAWCLQESELTAKQIDLVCYGFSNGADSIDLHTRLFQRLDDYRDNPEALNIILDRLRTEGDVDAVKRDEFISLTEELLPAVPVYRCSHHPAHQAAAFCPSPFDQALTISADGRGDYRALSIARVDRQGQHTELDTAFCWESLGYFYGRVTSLCGFTPNRHEGKVTGLAAHGDPTVAMPLMEKMIGIEAGKIRSYPGAWYRPFFSNYSEALITEAARFSREDLAAAAQEHLERIICQRIQLQVEETGIGDICLAGGVFANIKLNQRIREIPGVDEVFVFPHMGDGGLAAGAVYHYLWKNRISTSLPTLDLGPRIDPDTLALQLQAKGINVEKPQDLLKSAVSRLASGDLIGLVQGGCEFGPRALGMRSILSTPASVAQCARINRSLKRDGFMPFAPAIADHLAASCLEDYNPGHISPHHMTLSYRASELLQQTSPAVVHVDHTTRPQVVTAEDNPFLHTLLDRWHQETGIPCLLNTSFNMHEEPIVCTEADVVRSFLQGAVDHLLFPPYQTA